jgi:hypothetical protein
MRRRSSVRGAEWCLPVKKDRERAFAKQQKSPRQQARCVVVACRGILVSSQGETGNLICCGTVADAARHAPVRGHRYSRGCDHAARPAPSEPRNALTMPRGMKMIHTRSSCEKNAAWIARLRPRLLLS